MRWLRQHPPQATEVLFFVDQRFGKLELGTLMKDNDDQHCLSSWFAAANQVNNANFQIYFYFCYFEIVTFSKTIIYIHKLVFAAKKSILKFNGLSNIHNFKFAFGCLFEIILPLKRTKCILRQPNFQNFPDGCMPPLSPRGSRPWHTFGPSCRWILPHTPSPAKKNLPMRL